MKIELELNKRLTLNGLDEDLRLNYDYSFPFCSWGCSGSVEGFLENLKDYCKKLKFNIDLEQDNNRKDTLNLYRAIECRKEHIDITEIKFSVGVEANMRCYEIFGKRIQDLVNDVLMIQKNATQEQELAVKKYIELLNQKKLLDKLGKGASLDYSYKNRFNDTSYLKTKTLNISINEYNKRLKEIQKEIKELCSKHKFLSYSDYKFNYIKKPLSFDKWFEEQKETLKDEYEEGKNDAEDNDEEMESFDDFADRCYEYYLMNFKEYENN